MITLSEWGIQVTATSLRVYHIPDGEQVAEEDIEVPLTILPELYNWLETRLEIENKGAQG